jgi:hypothetical protein
MKTVPDEATFGNILRAETAILFFDFDWSGQARLSRLILQEWERTAAIWNPGEDISIWRVLLDDQPWAVAWLPKDHDDLAGGGHGALVWLRKGSVTEREPAAYAAGIRELSRKTKAAFSRRV